MDMVTLKSQLCFDILCLKDACTDRQPRLPTFLKQNRDFGTRSWVAFDRLYVCLKVTCEILCSSMGKSENKKS